MDCGALRLQLQVPGTWKETNIAAQVGDICR